MLQLIEQSPNILQMIWFTGEAKFYTDGLVECHLFKYADEKTCDPDELELLNERYVTVWAAMNHNNVIGPYFLNSNEGENTYQDLLDEFVSDLSKITPVEEKPIFMHDNISMHTDPKIKKFLEVKFPHQWIGQGSSYLTWPHHSPDLNPLNFCLWGFIKNNVFKTPINSDELIELENRILSAFKKIKPQMLDEAVKAYKEKLEQVVQTNGAFVDIVFSFTPTKFHSNRHFEPSSGIASLMYDSSDDSD